MKKIAFSLIVALAAVPAFAVEFTSGDFKANVYGELYVDGFYTYSNDGAEGSNSFGSQGFVGSSLLGVELSYGNVKGTFEAGLGDPVRRYFLTYNIGGAEDHFLVVGRDTTIAAYSFGQVSNDAQSLNDFGTLADNRRLQVRYGVKGFELAVVIPSLGSGIWNEENVNDPGYLYNERNEKDEVIFSAFEVLPRVELAYTYSNDSLEFKVFGAYGAYMYTGEGLSDKVLHSYNVGIGGQANFGNSFLQYTGWYGNNLNLMGALGNLEHNNISAGVENIQSAGVALGIGHTFNDKYTPQIGVGYTLNFGDGYDKMDDSLGAYLNCIIQINDLISITPEIAYLNRMKNSSGASEGYDIIAGVVASLIF